MSVEQIEIEATPELRCDAETSCPACRADRQRLWGNKNGHDLKQCLRCGSIFTCVPDGGDDLSKLYDHYYDRAQFELPSVVADSLDRLALSFERFRSTGRWLDIGYGEGGLLTIAERRGWTCYGAEISPSALEYGKERGWVVTTDAEHDARFPAQGFDVVTMIEFIEHATAPELFLKSAARWLRPGGLLYITTPNAESINRRILRSNWSIFAPPEHITIWTSRGLQHALARAGFRKERVRAEGFNPAEIIALFKSRKQGGDSVNRNETALELNAAFSASPFRRAVKSVINHGLSAFRLGDRLKVWALREELPKGEREHE